MAIKLLACMRLDQEAMVPFVCFHAEGHQQSNPILQCLPLRECHALEDICHVVIRWTTLLCICGLWQ